MDILHLSFNQETTHLCCSTNKGFIIYKLTPSVEKRIYTELHKGVGIMKMLNATNLSVMVGGGDNPFRKSDTVVVWDDHKKGSILEVEVKETIRNTLITVDSIIVITDNKIRIFSLTNGSILGIKDTYPNKDGICKINPGGSNTLVTLGKKRGELLVWRLDKNEHITIKGHDNMISTVAINTDGSLIATTSDTGTNIHIYDTHTSELKYKFRRGSTGAHIYDICFDFMSKHLACYSRNGTIHIFDIYNKEDGDTKNITSMLVGFKDYLPDYFSSQWSPQKVYLEDTTKAVCSFDKKGVLHVVTYGGNYYRISGVDGKYDSIIKSGLYPDQS